MIAGLQSENVNTPLGRLNRGGTEYPLRISGKPDAVEQFKTMVIARRGGRPIPLAEVAQIQDGIEEQRSLALVNGIPGHRAGHSQTIRGEYGGRGGPGEEGDRSPAEGASSREPPSRWSGMPPS